MAESTRGRTVDDRERVDRRTPSGNVAHDDRDLRQRDAAAGPAVVRERQRDEYGGFNIGAAFFGWLGAVGIAVLLTALLSAAGAAIGLTELSEGEAESNAETISIAGGILLIAVLAISYYAGGYVAGRMSRFDGGRQGWAVWLIGIVVTIMVVVIGAVFGSQYDIFARVDLPSLPIPTDAATIGGLITLAAVILGTLLAAVVGGKAGQRYHRRIDRVSV